MRRLLVRYTGRRGETGPGSAIQRQNQDCGWSETRNEPTTGRCEDAIGWGMGHRQLLCLNSPYTSCILFVLLAG